MESILGYTSSDGDAVVLEVQGEEVETILGDDGSDWTNWPQDLGVYNKAGLWIWEGEIDGDNWTGNLRDLTPEEWRNLQIGKSPL